MPIGRFPLSQCTRALAASFTLWAAAGGVQAQVASAPAEVSLQVRALQSVVVQPQREVLATLRARNEARIAAEVAGTVTSWSVDAGGRVERGAVLAQIDDGEYRLALQRAAAALQAAQARLGLAEAQARRARELVAQNFLAQEVLSARETELGLARAEHAAAQASQASAERAVRLTTVRAPFDAHVRQRLAQRGEYVPAGTPLYVLSERDAGEVVALIAPAELDGLLGSADIAFVARGRRHPVRVLRVAGTVEPTARTQELRLGAAGVPAVQTLAPGTEGRLVWRDARAHLPASLLLRRGEEIGIYIVQSGRARFVAVPQAQEGRAAPVPDGLAPQTPVVTSGQAGLRDGQPVTVGAAGR